MSRKIIGNTVGTPIRPQKLIEKTKLDERVSKLSEEKADKEYVVSVFEELKRLLQNGETDSAIALLDSAILDLSTLA